MLIAFISGWLFLLLNLFQYFTHNNIFAFSQKFKKCKSVFKGALISCKPVAHSLAYCGWVRWSIFPVPLLKFYILFCLVVDIPTFSFLWPQAGLHSVPGGADEGGRILGLWGMGASAGLSLHSHGRLRSLLLIEWGLVLDLNLQC